MLERGRVVRIDGNTATIDMEASDACTGCTVCRSTGSSKRLLDVEAIRDLREGQNVTVEISTGWALGTLFFVLILPLFAFLVGALVGRRLLASCGVALTADGAALVVGGSFFIVTLAVGILISRIRAVVRHLKPRIVRID